MSGRIIICTQFLNYLKYKTSIVELKDKFMHLDIQNIDIKYLLKIERSKEKIYKINR